MWLLGRICERCDAQVIPLFPSPLTPSSYISYLQNRRTCDSVSFSHLIKGWRFTHLSFTTRGKHQNVIVNPFWLRIFYCSRKTFFRDPSSLRLALLLDEGCLLFFAHIFQNLNTNCFFFLNSLLSLMWLKLIYSNNSLNFLSSVSFCH